MFESRTFRCSEPNSLRIGNTPTRNHKGTIKGSNLAEVGRYGSNRPTEPLEQLAGWKKIKQKHSYVQHTM